MKQYDENIQRQLAKPQTWFVKYFPVRIGNVTFEQRIVRQVVFDFKDGKSFELVASETAKYMKKTYGKECKSIVFSCVPASSYQKNEIRYRAFSERVCELTGAIYGFQHVKVIGERLAIHENRQREKEVRKACIIDFDTDFFKDKKVLVFDDVITKGLSYANYANQIESLGANVLGGVFLARTHYKAN